MDGGGGQQCYLSQLLVYSRMYFLLHKKKKNDALASTGHKARVNSNIIVSLLDQEVYFAFLTLLSNVFLGSVFKEEKLSTLSTRREEAS